MTQQAGQPQRPAEQMYPLPHRGQADALTGFRHLLDRKPPTGVGDYRMLQCYCDDRSWALRRLLYAEITRFPDLLDIIQGHGNDRVTEALADRLARLSLACHLRASDPYQAAEQFIALLTGPIEARSRFGTRPVPDTELRDIVRAAVHTFLQAFAAEPTQAP